MVVAEVRHAVSLALGEGGLRPASGRVLLALSGGPDSRVLLDVLVALREKHQLRVDVCVVDHGLRHGSAREAQGALEVAHHLGVAGTVERVNLVEKSPRGARDARYAALARAAVACGADAIVLGHTASDQAETLIDHLLRGAGSRGLGAMAPRRMLGALPDAGVATDHLTVVRPLLEVTRAEVEAYVEHEGLGVVRDPTNEDLRYRRSRIRQRVLPLLRDERPDLDRALVRLSERLRLDAEYLDGEAARQRATFTVPGGLLDLEGMSSLHLALQARILREMCEEVGVPGDRVPLDALLRLCRGRHGTSQIDLALGQVAERRYSRLRIGEPQLVQAAPDEVPVRAAGTYELGSLLVRVPKKLLSSGATLVFRRPRAGDRIDKGKLSDLLVDQKVARPERGRLWALAEEAGPGVPVPGPGKVRWVGLAAEGGGLAWEWPSSGLRPRAIRHAIPKSGAG